MISQPSDLVSVSYIASMEAMTSFELVLAAKSSVIFCLAKIAHFTTLAHSLRLSSIAPASPAD